MSGVNKAILLGRLGKDPETRQTGNGISVTTITLATSETFKDANGEKKENTEWHTVVLWRGLSEIAAKWLHKGDQVYIEGKLRTRSWEKDGVKRYTTEIVADALQMLSSKGAASNTNGSNGNGAAHSSHVPPSAMANSDFSPALTPPPNGASDDLPF